VNYLQSKIGLNDIDIQAKKLCRLAVNEYEIAFTQLKEDYEKAKEMTMNALYQRIKELSVFSPAFEAIPNNILRIHSNCDVIQNNKNLISKIKNEYVEKKRNFSFKQNSESELSNHSYSTFGEREAANKEVNITVETLESNSNYDFELGATEAQNLWKKHIGESSCQMQYENRFKKMQKKPFNSDLSKISREQAHVEIDDSNIYKNIR
jgi:hypothetical protein